MPRVARALLTSVSILGLAVPIIRAQQESQGQRQVAQPQPQDPTVAQKLDKAQKKKIKKSLKELDTPYKQWLNEDVTYIISPEERNAFGQLATNEEREQFIEQFWLRRSSNPDLPDNEFKEEHYRRIAYANEHYASGIPGWKTDRGHMYIVWGPPDEIESHPTGGTYDRPMEEGGGSTIYVSVGNVAVAIYRGHGRKRDYGVRGSERVGRISPDDGSFGKGCIVACAGRWI